MTADSLADVTESLMLEFQDDLALSTISGVVLGARHDLAGQVFDAAFPEMLQRLARTRLEHLRRAHQQMAQGRADPAEDS